MKTAAFNKLIADAYSTPEKTVNVFARLLKEAGLVTTGARGRNAPEMTPLDAARLTIAILTTDSPSECVERVKRFGGIKYAPAFRKGIRGYETMQPEAFAALFRGETLEEVLAFIFSLPAVLGIEESCKRFTENVFHLRVSDFDVLAELFQWKFDGDEVVGELVVPFKGDPRAIGYSLIGEGVRCERSISGIHFLEIGLSLLGSNQNIAGDA